MKNIIFAFFIVVCVIGCAKETIKENPVVTERCELGGNISCVLANVTHQVIELEIENRMGFDVEVTEVYIYNAGTCGTERLNGDVFPGLLKSRARGIIKVVCNTIPEHVLSSPILIRYKNPQDLILRTERGSLVAIVKD